MRISSHEIPADRATAGISTAAARQAAARQKVVLYYMFLLVESFGRRLFFLEGERPSI